MKKILLIALLGFGYAESMICAEPSGSNEKKGTEQSFSAQALNFAKNAFVQGQRASEQVANSLLSVIHAAKATRDTLAIAPKKIYDNLPSRNSTVKMAAALTILTLFAKREPIKRACIDVGNAAAAGLTSLKARLKHPKTWLYLYLLRLLYSLKIKNFQSERLYLQDNLSAGVGKKLENFINEFRPSAIDGTKKPDIHTWLADAKNTEKLAESLKLEFTGFKSSAKAAVKAIEGILKNIEKDRNLKSFNVKDFVVTPLKNVITELKTVETSFVHFNFHRVVHGIEMAIGQLCAWRDDIRTNPAHNHFNLEEIAALQKVVIDLNRAKKLYLLFDLQNVDEQVSRDISTLGYWYVSVGASRWANIKYLLGLGVKPSVTIQNVDRFDTAHIIGSNWGLYNLWDLRYGSEFYKNNFLKLQVLAQVIQHLKNAKGPSGAARHELAVTVGGQVPVELTTRQGVVAPSAD